MNSDRGEAIIKLGGEAFTLRPTFAALKELEDRTNAGLVELVMRLSGGRWRITDLYEIIRAGIIGNGQKPPPNLGDLIIAENVPEVARAVAIYLTDALTGGQSSGGGGAGEA